MHRPHSSQNFTKTKKNNILQSKLLLHRSQLEKISIQVLSEAVARRCFVKNVTQVFSCAFCEISKNTFSYSTHPVAAIALLNQLYQISPISYKVPLLGPICLIRWGLLLIHKLGIRLIPNRSKTSLPTFMDIFSQVQLFNQGIKNPKEQPQSLYRIFRFIWGLFIQLSHRTLLPQLQYQLRDQANHCFFKHFQQS